MNNPASVALEVMHVLVQYDWPRNLLSHDPGQNSPTEDRVSANVLNGTSDLMPGASCGKGACSFASIYPP